MHESDILLISISFALNKINAFLMKTVQKKNGHDAIVNIGPYFVKPTSKLYGYSNIFEIGTCTLWIIPIRTFIFGHFIFNQRYCTLQLLPHHSVLGVDLHDSCLKKNNGQEQRVALKNTSHATKIFIVFVLL